MSDWYEHVTMLFKKQSKIFLDNGLLTMIRKLYTTNYNTASLCTELLSLLQRYVFNVGITTVDI